MPFMAVSISCRLCSGFGSSKAIALINGILSEQGFVLLVPRLFSGPRAVFEAVFLTAFFPKICNNRPSSNGQIQGRPNQLQEIVWSKPISGFPILLSFLRTHLFPGKTLWKYYCFGILTDKPISLIGRDGCRFHLFTLMV